MASITAIDSIIINAPPQRVFDVISDYENMGDWFEGYRCKYINGTAFQEGLEVFHQANKVTKFTRHIDRFTNGEEICESYISGDLIGTGVWRFEAQDGGGTKASFDCTVKAQKWIIALAFKLTGAKGHKDVYAKLLAALKTHCENTVE
ncbi:MAG: SRPBCC family protein [Maricaulaceae bacterium]